MVKNMKTDLNYNLTISDIIRTYESVVKVINKHISQKQFEFFGD